MANVIDSVFGQPSNAAPQQSADIIGSVFGGQAAPQTGGTSDIVNSVFGGGQPGTPTSPSGASGDDNRMGEGESALSRPLTTYLGVPEYREGAGGFERGVEKFASGLTSPLSLGLMIATGGLGGLAEAGAVGAGEAAAPEALSMFGKAGASILSHYGPEAAATIAKTAGTVEKLTNLGFTGQQIYDLTKSVPRIGDAIKAGDTDTAIEMLTSSALNAVAAGASTAHLLRGQGKEPIWSKEKEAIGAADHQRTFWGIQANKFRTEHAELIKNKPLDMAGMLYHEAGGTRIDAGFTPTEVDTIIGRMPTLDEKTIREAESLSLPETERQFNKFADEVDRLVKEGKPIGDPEYAAANDRASLYKDIAHRKVAVNAQLTTTEQLSKWRDQITGDKNIAPAMRDRWVSYLDQAMRLPEELKGLSKDLAGKYGDIWQMYKDRDIVHDNSDGRTFYAGPHIYELGDEGKSTVVNRNIKRNPQHLKQRTYDNAIDAVKEGFEPTHGLAEAHAEYLNQVGQKMGHYHAEKELLTQLGEDGRPIAVSPAAVRPVIEAVPGEGTTIKEGRTRDGLPIMGLGQADLDRLPPDMLFQDQKGNWYLDVSDYKQGPDVFTRRRMIAKDEDGKPVTIQKPLQIHPDYLAPVNKAFADSSWFREVPLLNAVLKGSSIAKHTLLSASPFHWNTEYLRGIQMGLNPLEALNPKAVTETSRSATSKFPPTLAIASGDAMHGLKEFREGLGTDGGGLLGHIPLIGPTLGWLEQRLFGANGYIDRLKSSTFEKVAKQLEGRHPNWATDQVDFAASRMVDAAFGGLNYKQLGVSMNTRDAARLLFLAPDFTGSQVLFAKYGFQPGGSVIARSLGRVAVYNFAIAQMLNLLHTGQVRLDHPFGVVSADDKKTWTIRTMPQDVWHFLTDPRQFAYNRLNPVITRTGWEWMTGRNEQGKQVTGDQQFTDFLRNITPISSQNFVPAFRRPDETIPEGMARAAGFTALPNRSSAENTARELASGHAPTGPVKPEQLERHQLVLDLENKLQSKEITMEAVQQALQAGKISKKDLADITKSLRESQIMDPADARLYRYASRLPADEFLKVWSVATPPERRDLRMLLLKKYQGLVKEAVPSDPVLKRFQAIVGEPTAQPRE